MVRRHDGVVETLYLGALALTIQLTTISKASMYMARMWINCGDLRIQSRGFCTRLNTHTWIRLAMHGLGMMLRHWYDWLNSREINRQDWGGHEGLDLAR